MKEFEREQFDLTENEQNLYKQLINEKKDLENKATDLGLKTKVWWEEIRLRLIREDIRGTIGELATDGKIIYRYRLRDIPAEVTEALTVDSNDKPEFTGTRLY